MSGYADFGNGIEELVLVEPFKTSNHFYIFSEFFTEANGKKKNEEEVTNAEQDVGVEMFGPLIVIGTGALVVVICGLFCSVDPSAPHKKAKKKAAVDEEAEQGQTNQGFVRDDVSRCSRTSRRTVETDVGEECVKKKAKKAAGDRKAKVSAGAGRVTIKF